MSNIKDVELLLPELGEGIQEATITNWLCEEGEEIEEDQSVLEVSTDKVDTEIPSLFSGTIVKILHQPNEVIAVGQPLAILKVAVNESNVTYSKEISKKNRLENTTQTNGAIVNEPEEVALLEKTFENKTFDNEALNENVFLSPLVKSICKVEGVSNVELNNIKGSGKKNRITKADMLLFLEQRKKVVLESPNQEKSYDSNHVLKAKHEILESMQTENGLIEKIKMTRTRRLISKRMVESLNTAAHVTSFVECDMTRVFNWREKNKNQFLDKHGIKITYLPIVVQAVIKAIKDFPMINVSVDGDYIIKKNFINMGIATALSNNELIVPVLKNADQYSLVELAIKIKGLIDKARNGDLEPRDVSGGTYTVSNIGTFGNILGTPIINQPQSAILAVGNIEKKPAIVSTEEGDVIAIRNKVYLSHSYDHRVIDGYLGGSFVKRISDHLENFNVSQVF